METVYCVMGPTASGKSALALQLVEQCVDIDIISVDAAMVYRGLDIGTAKPSLEEQARCPHALIDICEPEQAYSAAQFCLDARREIDASLAKGRKPVLVGGTMLYFSALQQGLADMPEADEALRQRIAEEAERVGWPALHQQLSEIDAAAAARIHPHDGQRIQRAIEVYRLSGKTLTEHWKNAQEKAEYRFYNIGLLPSDRAWLHQRIAERFQQMLDAGFLNEVEQLYQQQRYDLSMPSIRSVGYRQAWQYLQGELSYDMFVEKAIVATRQLAKRQLTWLRKMPLDLRIDAIRQTDESIVGLVSMLGGN